MVAMCTVAGVLAALVRALKSFINILIALVRAPEVLGIPTTLYWVRRAIVGSKCTRKLLESFLRKRVLS